MITFNTDIYLYYKYQDCKYCIRDPVQILHKTFFSFGLSYDITVYT